MNSIPKSAHRQWPAALLLALLTLWLPATGITQAFDQQTSGSLLGNDDFLPVEQAYPLRVDFTTGDDGQPGLHLDWQIAEGYYLYQHAFKFIINDGGQSYPVDAELDEGLPKVDEYFGDVVVYYHYAGARLAPLPAEGKLTLAVTSQGCADAGLCYPPRTQYFAIDSASRTITELDQAPALALSADRNTGIRPTAPGLAWMLGFALLGGMLLNLMPCVFPVLSLKVLSFSQHRDHPHALQGIAYCTGVVLSFIAVAGVLIALRQAGEAVGWGFQLQSPWFVGALTYLFFVMGLGLIGFVEIGAGWAGAGQTLTERPGLSGSFFTGVLATLVASPCTAPFMGAALGFAVTQSPATAILVFAALGLGMALPLLLLSCSPALLRHFPRPGPWMERFKQLLAFPLFATALWLAWVIGNQAGAQAMTAIIGGCLLLAFALWCWRSRLPGQILAVLSAAAALAILGNPMLATGNGTTTANPAGNTGGNWEPYSQERLNALRRQGQPVFLNITADWCITCLANEKVTLNTDRVQQAMRTYGVVYMKGDWTNRDDRITALLAEYQRNGIPLYLAFPRDPSQPARILPQILTRELVIEALAEL